MTQITIRNIDDHLTDRVQEAARASGDSINELLLKLLRREFGCSEPKSDNNRNDLGQYRVGWFEDNNTEAAMTEHAKIDDVEWR